MFGAAAMSLSSFCVVSNALRLKLFRPKFHTACSEGSCPLSNAPDPVPAADNNHENLQERTETEMNKTIKIEGMMCDHCKMRVEKALSGVAGVSSVAVDLAAKQAVVTLSAPVEDSALTAAVTEAGYEVTGIE